MRQTKKLTVLNMSVKKTLKEFTKAVNKAVAEKDAGKVKEYAAKIQKVVDKAAQARIIKKNNANRRKSRLVRKVNAFMKSVK